MYHIKAHATCFAWAFIWYIKLKKIRPLILVGIENTQRRRDLTGYTEIAKDKEIAPVVGGSEKFRAFIRDELFAEIDKRYRTTNEKSIIGESLSGLFVLETFLLTPDLFDNYIAFDPSLWWNNHYLVRTAKEHLAKFPASEKRIWFAASNAEDISPYTKELADIFKTENHINIKWLFAFYTSQCLIFFSNVSANFSPIGSSYLPMYSFLFENHSILDIFLLLDWFFQ